jgi:arylsulfatase
LYHVADDFAENHNVAADDRDTLIALIGSWYVEAGKYNVMPIDGSGLARMVAEKPMAATPRDHYSYRPRTQSIPFNAAPRVLNRPHTITAFVEIPDDGAEGVLLCQGTAAGGYSLFVNEGKLHYVHNYVGRSLHRVSSPETIPPGQHELRFEFEPTGKPDLSTGRGAPGRLQLYVDKKLVAETDAPVTTPFAFNPGAVSCGANPGSPVTPDYTSPFRFTGTLHRVDVDTSGELIIDSESEMRLAMARQ